MAYFIGTTLRFNLECRLDGVLADHDVVAFRWRPPGTLADDFSEYIYGTDPQIVRDGVGLYHVEFLFDQIGLWRFKAVGIGDEVTSTCADHITVDVVGLPGW